MESFQPLFLKTSVLSLIEEDAMPMSPGGTKTGTTGTTRKAVAKKVKVNQAVRSMIRAVKHATFSGTGYKTGKKIK
jgi:hypothetical protein